MKRKFRLLGIVASVGILLGGYFVFNFYRVFFLDNTAFENKTSYIFIDSDDTIDSLELALTPLLKSIHHFKTAAVKKGYANRVRPGKYAIEKGSGNHQIIVSLRSKNIPVGVVFNNQERLENLAGRVAQQIEADSTALLEAFWDSKFLSDKGLTKQNALTIFLPNSYQFYWNVSPEAFRDRMWEEYGTFWNAERESRALAIGLSPLEVTTLASIVQKEALKPEEYSKIAGVYLNRLKRRMKLQADPTVIYALKAQSGNFDLVIRRVLNRDLKIDSPFNTYKINGLPPAPICMPDIATIEAVLQPEKHNYLYFVVDPTRMGYHSFASSLRAHNRNRKKYTDWLNKQRLYR